MKKLFSLFLVIMCFSCGGGKEVTESELLAFVKDEANGLKKTVEYDEFTVTATYKATDFIVRQQMEKGSVSEMDSLRRVYAPYLYFTLTIEKDGKDLETAFAYDPGTFAGKISYLTSSFSENILLVSGSQQESLADYMYSRSFGSGPSSFLLVFKKPSGQDFDLVVEGHDLGFGKLRFPFNLDDIENTPHLKL